MMRMKTTWVILTTVIIEDEDSNSYIDLVKTTKECNAVMYLGKMGKSKSSNKSIKGGILCLQNSN